MTIINGANASDILSGGVSSDLINAGNGDDIVDGGAGDDAISGGRGNDVLSGGSGNDELDGGAGNDVLSGGADNDELDGGNGNDILSGDTGNDELNGGRGDDILDGGSGDDRIEAGSGNDIVVHVASENGGSYDEYKGGSGHDTLRLIVTSAVHASAAFQADLAAFQAKLAQGSASHHFSSLNVQASSFESLEVVIDNGANQAPTDIVLSGTSVVENSANGTVVGNLSAIDPDAGDSKTFTLVDNAGGRFAILDGNLVVSGLLDHEAAASHQVTVRVTDSAGNSYDETFTIAVTNVDDNFVVGPTDSDGTTNSVKESAGVGTAVGVTAIATDADAGASITYSLSNDAGGRFVIDPATGEVTVAGGIDFEATESHTITVVATSSDGSTNSQNFVIAVTNANEAPTAITLDTANVDEGATGAVIGALAFTDPDVGDTVELSVDDDRFEVVDGSLKLKDGVALDFEQASTVEVIVSATDAGGLVFSQSFTITVNNGLEGTGVDGYIAGATVFADTDDDGIWDVGEATTTTDANGQFTLVGGTGPLVLSGGTDIATGQAFTGIMRAPTGSTVVTPLTTVVASLISNTVTEAEANSQVLAALGLSPAVDLSTFDPIAATLSTDPATQAAGEAVFAAAIQVQNTISQAAAVLAGAGAEDIGTAIAAVVDALASEITAAIAPIDLGDATLIASIITVSGAAVAGVNDDAVALVADEAATIITASNELVEAAAASEGGVDLLVTLSQVAAVAQGAASQSIADATIAATTGDTGAIAASVSDFTGAALDTAVATTTVGDVDGANSSDTINGTAGADTLFGYGGNDTLNGGDGDDILNGGDGDDILNGGSGLNTLIGGSGNDTLNGKELVEGPNNRDSDKADYSGATGAIVVSLSAASTVTGDASVGADTLNRINWVVGTDFADTYVATSFVSNQFGTFNEFEGGGGNDQITGNGSTRVGYRYATEAVTVDFQGGAGFGTGRTTSGAAANVGIDQFTGVNSVAGSQYDDTLLGSDAATFEQFRGHAGNDYIDGRGGTQDLAAYRNSPNGIVAILSSGTVQDGWGFTDTLVNIEQIQGSEFNDQIIGDAGNNVLQGMFGADILDGGVGFDTLSYSGPSITGLGVNVNLLTGAASGGDATGDVFSNFENITGSRYADSLTGDNLANRLDGGIGNDTLAGLGGDDTLIGGDGDDTLDGGSGFNQFFGGAGNDTLIGGNALTALDGNRADYSGASGPITVSMGTTSTVSGNASVGLDTLQNIDGVVGTGAADSFTALANQTINQFGTFAEFEGGGGNDTITGNGNTRISYRSASEGVTVDLAAGTGRTTSTNAANVGVDAFTGVNAIRGSSFGDILLGTDGNGFESFRGQAGNDFIDGGGGFQDRADYNNSNFGIIATLGVDGIIGKGTVVDGFVQNGIGSVDTLANIEQIRGSTFADTIIGDSGNNFIEGGAGADIMDGGAGFDGLGYGNSIAGIGVTVNLLTGHASGGDATGDVISGFENLNGSRYDDVLTGDAGNNSIDGFAGADTMDGGDGIDTLNYGSSNAGVGVNVDLHNRAASGGDATGDVFSNFENLSGTRYHDVLTGDVGNNQLRGQAGNDTVSGGAGNDFLDGQADADTAVFTGNRADYIITGSPGALVITDTVVDRDGTDTVNNVEFVQFADGLIATADLFTINGDQFNNYLVGTGVNDIINGLGGDDTIVGLAGNDIINGGINGPFVDNVDYSGSPAGIVVNLLSGNAQDGWGTVDQLSGIEGVIDSPFSDTITGDANTNWVRLGNGTDTVDAGAGIDVVFYEFAPSGVTINLSAGTAIDGFGNTDTILNFENAHGSYFNDSVTLTDGSGYVFGRAGNDNLYALGGDDSLTAGSGDDLIDGGFGRDTARYVDDGFDGTGPSTSGVTVNLAMGTATDNWGGTDTLVSIENVQGSGLNDAIIGNSGDNFLDGGAGDDNIDGGIGLNTLVGGAGNDTLAGSGLGGTFDFNTADYASATSGITVLLSSSSWVMGDASVGTDTLIYIDRVLGSQYADSFMADATLVNQFGTLAEFEGRGGNDTITGNNNTRVSYAGASEGVTVDFSLGTGKTTSGAVANVGVDTFTGVSQVRGSAHADTLLGSNTTLWTEVFRGQAGNDFIDGRGGQDRVDYNGSTSSVTLTLGDGDTAGTASDGFGGTDTLYRIEQVRGSHFNDTLTGNSDGNRFIGLGGNDTINGMGGVDWVDYNIESDRTGIVADLGTGSVSDGYGFTDALINIENIRGSMFADVITGNDAANVLDAQGGNDALTGGLGDDTIIGGAGADRFVIADGHGVDTLADFVLGEDILDLTGVTGFVDFASMLSNASDGGGPHTTITIGVGHSVILQNITDEQLAAADASKFLF